MLRLAETLVNSVHPVAMSQGSTSPRSGRFGSPRRIRNLGYGVVIGLLLGGLLGVLTGNLGLWIAVGAAVGVAAGVATDLSKLFTASNRD